MVIEPCQQNIRCDTLCCNSYATKNINTCSHKGNIYLCEKCFDSLFEAMKNMKKQINKIKEKTK